MDERQLGELGLRLALSRLRERVGAEDPMGCRICLAEALGWLYSLHEVFRERLGNHRFFSRVRGSVDGGTFLGLIWARGAVSHHLTNVTYIVMDETTSGIPGAAVPGLMRLGSAGTLEPHWVEVDAVPSLKRPEKHGRDAMYDRCVGGQLLLPPLERVFLFVTGFSCSDPLD